jgi:hypothetical protein
MNEATAALFNDSGLDEALETSQVSFSPKIDTELRRLRVLLRESLTAQESRGTAAVLASTEWQAVRNEAGKLLEEIIRRR